MLILIAFFLATLSSCCSQSVPSFFIYQQDGDTAPLQELPNVALRETASVGNILIQWNAAFTSYHTAVIKRSNYQVQLFCQCTANNVQQVTFFYLPSTGTTSSPLQVDSRTSISTDNWPAFGPTQAQTTNINFNSTNGAYATISFNNIATSIDMSGTFRCELMTTSGVTLQSNVFGVFDVRKAVSALAVPQPLGVATLYQSGVGIFQLTSILLSDMNQITNYMNLNLDWSISDIVLTNPSTPEYIKGPTYFKPASKMSVNDLGQYHVTQNGTLYVNMGSAIGQILQTMSSILMLSDASAIVGYKYFTKPANLQGASSTPVPFVAEPTSPNFPKTTFVNNNDHTMACGFLSSSKDLNIVWSKDGTQLTASDMQQKYGVVSRNPNMPNVLDLRGVNVQAKGVWQCTLNEKNTATSYDLKVLRYPTFTSTNSPPPVVFATESATVTITCAASSLDITNSVAVPQIYINNILFSDFCTTTQPTSASLCEIKKHVSFQTNYLSASSDTRWSKYTISLLPFRSSSTFASLNHVVSCKAQGIYLSQTKQQISIAATVSSSINIVPKLTNAQFKTLNLNQCSQSLCPITDQALTFLCEIKSVYVTSVLSTGAVIQQYWRIGSFTQNDVMAITDNTSPLKKYMIFSNDGTNLTILPITSANDINTINNLGNLSCVIEFHYPSFINSANLSNLLINGTGAVQPDSSSSTVAPMFYTSDGDTSIQSLSVKLALGGNPQPSISSASVGIIVGVIFAIILVLLIIVILYFRFRNPEVDYHIRDKEIAQGRNPIKEFEDNMGFKNYDGDHKNQVDGKPTITQSVAPVVLADVRQMSITGDSVVSGSDEDNNTVNQYGEPEFGKFTEDGSFIGSYRVDPRRLPINLRQLPPQPQAYENKSYTSGNDDVTSLKSNLETHPQAYNNKSFTLANSDIFTKNTNPETKPQTYNNKSFTSANSDFASLKSNVEAHPQAYNNKSFTLANSDMHSSKFNPESKPPSYNNKSYTSGSGERSSMKLNLQVLPNYEGSMV